MNDGTLLTATKRPVIQFERKLPDPPEVVWRALTDRTELKQWFPTDIITDEWKEGATLTFEFEDHPDMTMTGTVLALDEPRLLAFTWGEETLRFELAPDTDGGTRLVFTDELDPNIAARNAAGWDVCLDRLAGATPAGAAWKPRFDHYVSVFEPALGPQEGPPPGFEAEHQ